jgi:hypothetical protein
MYKRTEKALLNTPPTKPVTCMFKAQFGKAEYNEIAYAITTRIDSAGCFGIIEFADNKIGKDDKQNNNSSKY